MNIITLEVHDTSGNIRGTITRDKLQIPAAKTMGVMYNGKLTPIVGIKSDNPRIIVSEFEY